MATDTEDKTTQVQATEQPTTGTALTTYDFGEDAGAGLDNITSEERTLPFVRIIQKGSPQVDDTHPLYATKKIDNAKAGMLLKTNTNEAFGVREKPFIFIPSHRDRNFVESWPRPKEGEPAPQGQGFVGIRPDTDPLVLKLLAEQGKFKILKTPEGTVLVDTWYLYGIFVMTTEPNMPDYVFPGVIGFKSTQIPYYKRFIDTVSGIRYPDGKGNIKNPAIWAHRWLLSTIPDSNKKGSFYSYSLKLANDASPLNPRPALMKMDDPYYIMAKELYLAVKAGKAKADHVGDEQSAEAGAGVKEGEEIPF